MSTDVRFTDGASYEQMMGVWSRIVGAPFLAWLDPETGLDWVDVGCGTGAFTAQIGEVAAPRSVLGLDPSAAQIAFAEQERSGGALRFAVGDGLALPLGDASVDQATSALVLFFMPDPAQGVSEMVRVTRPGGMVSSYVWDIPGGNFAYRHMNDAMASEGYPAMRPPRWEVAELGALEGLWQAAGLKDIETMVIEPERRYASFEDYWRLATSTPVIAPVLANMPAETLARVQDRVRDTLGRGEGPVTVRARAHAIKGRR